MEDFFSGIIAGFKKAADGGISYHQKLDTIS